MNRVLSLSVGVVLLGLGVLYYVTSIQSHEGVSSYVGDSLPAPAVTVTRTADGYEPKEITVKKGEVVVWKNESGDYHWPASDLHPTHAIYSEFDPLKPVASGQDWAFQFNQVGVWRYHDHIRANKVGSVTVTE